MDQRKNPKKPKKFGGSIDGIVSGNPQLGGSVHRSYQPARGQATPNLGAFINRVDGFHPSRASGAALGISPEDAETEALLDEPIILDDVSAKAKKQHYLKHKHPKLRKVIKRTSLAAASLVLILGGYLAFKFYIAERHLFHGGGGAPALADKIDINQLKGEGDGRINILLLGNGGPEHKDGSDLTDTIMIASIDPINHKTALLSIPRDLWVKIPGDGSRKINEAYYYGKLNSKSKSAGNKNANGVNWVDKTLEPDLGIPIHYHVVVDFSAFRQTVNAVGGVDINVPKELAVKDTLWDESTHHNYHLNVKAGQQHFDGTKALMFSRTRYTSTRGDFDRSERQRLMLSALKSKVFSAGTFSNPVKISNLLSGLGNNVYTDFSRSDITALYKIIGKIPASRIASVDLVTPPHDLLTTANLGGISIVEPKDGLSDFGGIRNYVRNALRDGFIAKENASVAVYNATSVNGLAASKANFLKSFGYSITTVDNAPVSTNPHTTILVDLTKGGDKYTRHYLEGRFGVTARNSMPAGSGLAPPAGTNFVIILGTDAANSG